MKKEMLMMEDVFSWQDIINFCGPNFCFNYESIKDFCIRKSDREKIEHRINSHIYNLFINKFPDFPFDKDFFDYQFIVKNVDDINNVVFLEKNKFLLEILCRSSNRKVDKEKLRKVFDIESVDFNENYINELRLIKNEINDDIKQADEILFGYTPEFKVRINQDDYREALIKKRKLINWTIRNYQELINFFEEAIDLKIFDGISKDKFLLCHMAGLMANSGVLDTGSIYVETDFIAPVMDYCRLIEYMVEVNNGEQYNVSFSNIQNDGSLFVISIDTIKFLVNAFYERYNGDIEELGFSKSYEEVLSKRASKTWKRIQSEKHAKNIQLNFEMIKSGKKISLSNYKNGSYVKVTSDKERVQANLKKAYDLLDEKMEYFSKTNPAMELVGINTFTGYTAYMYSNGVVILEKLYKKIDTKNGREIIVPAKDEAIYVMNYSEFIDLSQYTKPELMQEITDFQNPNVKRIYHTPNGSWKEKVDKLINGSGYGDLDYELFDQIISNLSDSKPKQLIKTDDEVY